MEDKIAVAVLSYAHPGHATAYSQALLQTPGVDLVAIYDEQPERGQAFARQLGVRDYYSTPEPLLARDDIQAVVVCSPTDQHLSLVMAAARAGKHVLCEKPIATRLEDGRAMVAACRAAGVQFHVAFVCRFYPMLQAAKKLIEAGEIGPVYAIAGGNRGRPPLPPAYPPWITNPAQAGGGALADHSVHVTDAMRFLLGSEVESVRAEAGTLLYEQLAVDDCAILLLNFRNGVVASVDPSWSIPANNPYHYDFYLRILGADGLIELDDTWQALRVVRDGMAERGAVLEPFGADVDALMVQHFIRSVRAGEFLPPAASGEDGLRALEITLAAYEAAQQARAVCLPPAAGPG